MGEIPAMKKILKRREQGSEDLDTTKKKKKDKTQSKRLSAKTEGYHLRFKESRHVAKQQFEEDKLNGEERKNKKAKP